MTLARQLGATLLGGVLVLACGGRAPIDAHGGAGSSGTGAGGTGFAGTSGSAGSGIASSSGVAGTTGGAGSSEAGTAGTGLAGSSGVAGISGDAGTWGSAGASGVAGSTGVGTAAASGSAGPPEGWVNRTPAVLPTSWPSSRSSVAFVADDDAQRVVLYGGYSNALPVRDTWDWDGRSGSWTRHDVAPAGVFDGTAVAFDQRRNQVVLFGGESFPDAAPTNGLWQWGLQDAGWIATAPATNGAAPVSVGGAGLAYDYLLDHLLVFAARTNATEVWQWAPVSKVWTQRPSAGASPNGPNAVAWDPRSRVAVAFGGATGNELWQWTEATATWTQVTPTSGQSWPEPRLWAAMTLDRDAARMLLFGGYGKTSRRVLNDLWQWRSGEGWKLLDDGTGPNAPPPRSTLGMTYDLAIARTVIFGGQTDSGDLADIWTYQGEP